MTASDAMQTATTFSVRPDISCLFASRIEGVDLPGIVPRSEAVGTWQVRQTVKLRQPYARHTFESIHERAMSVLIRSVDQQQK
jgi:hypothetical protein